MYKTKEQIEALRKTRPTFTDELMQQTIDSLRCTEEERAYIRQRVAGGDGNMKAALCGTWLRNRGNS